MNLNKLIYRDIGKYPLSPQTVQRETAINHNTLSVLDAWNLCFPQEAYSLLEEGTNCKLIGRYKITNREELKRFLATRIKLIDEKNQTYSSHWINGKGKFRPGKELGFGRWKIIHLNFKADLKAMFDLLESSWLEVVDIGSNITIDELIAGNNIRSPVRVFMPRKPNPNGHLIYLAGVRLNNYPFVIGCIPYLERGKRPTPSEALISLMKKISQRIDIPYLEDVVIFGDSAFSTKFSIDYLMQKNYKFLLSVNQYPSSPIKKLKEKSVSSGDWNVLFNTQYNISVFLLNGTNGKNFKLISNNYTIENTEEEKEQEIMKEAYKTNFNVIDTFNKNFYSFRFPYKHMKWTSLFLDDLIAISLANSWALYCASNPNPVLKRVWSDMVASAIFETLSSRINKNQNIIDDNEN